MKKKSKFIIVALFVFMISIVSLSTKDKQGQDGFVIINPNTKNLKAGTYFVKVSARNQVNQTMNELAKVHIKYPKTFLSYENQEGIDAHDIIVLKDEFEYKDHNQLLSAGNAHAWSMEDGRVIDQLNVEVIEPKLDYGAVAVVRYSTDNGTATDVNVFEQNVMHIKLQELYMNQYPLLYDRFRTLSLFLIMLSIVPIGVFVVLFRYILVQNKKVLELLEEGESNIEKNI